MKRGKRTYEPKRFIPKHVPYMVHPILDRNGEEIRVGDNILYTAQEDFRYSRRTDGIKAGRLYLRKAVVQGSHLKKDGTTVGIDIKGEDSKRVGCIKVEVIEVEGGSRKWISDKIAVMSRSPLAIHNRPTKRMVCPRKGCEWPLEEEGGDGSGSGVYQCMRPDCDYVEIVEGERS